MFPSFLEMNDSGQTAPGTGTGNNGSIWHSDSPSEVVEREERRTSQVLVRIFMARKSSALSSSKHHVERQELFPVILLLVSDGGVVLGNGPLVTLCGSHCSMNIMGNSPLYFSSVVRSSGGSNPILFLAFLFPPAGIAI